MSYLRFKKENDSPEMQCWRLEHEREHHEKQRCPSCDKPDAPVEFRYISSIDTGNSNETDRLEQCPQCKTIRVVP